jgi:LmbE family N-acetylglucosaminyl deacetylase
MNSAIAIAAHPDDIEFMMAEFLLLLKDQDTRNNFHSGQVSDNGENGEGETEIFSHG